MRSHYALPVLALTDGRLTTAIVLSTTLKDEAQFQGVIFEKETWNNPLSKSYGT